MAGPVLYRHVKQLFEHHVGSQISEASLDRLSLLVTGIINAKSAAPARIATAVQRLGLGPAKAESVERRIRRTENDPRVTAQMVLHPLARSLLLLGHPEELILILDPTTQEDKVVLVSVNIWYRGRSLPLAWTMWPANVPLKGTRLWQRVEALLDLVQPLLPKSVPVTWLADRAFGTPAFIDLLTARGWDYVVRVQRQTVCCDTRGRERSVGDLAPRRGSRGKMTGKVFKKRGWRAASVVAFWGPSHPQSLCLITNRPPRWFVIRLYRRRFPIEATFRDYKSAGWQWEHGQVTDLEHMERLLVGMAIAVWVAILAGGHVAQESLAQPPTGKRRTRPWIGKHSLFTIGLEALLAMVEGACPVLLPWKLTGWNEPNWQEQICGHHARAFVFALAEHS
jgi:hypothetical protein